MSSVFSFAVSQLWIYSCFAQTQDPALKIVSPKRSERTENTTLPYQMKCKIKNVPMIYKQTLTGMQIRISGNSVSGNINQDWLIGDVYLG